MPTASNIGMGIASCASSMPTASPDQGNVRTLEQTLSLEVPVVVRLGERNLLVAEVMSWLPGSIIELDKHSDAELDLLINNKPIGCGSAVKVGENFGLRINYVGDLKSRILAMAPTQPANE